MPKEQREAVVSAVRPAADGEARADGGIGQVPVAHYAEFEGAHLVQPVALNEAAHGFLARIRGVGAATVAAVSRISRQHTKDGGGRAGPNFPSAVLREGPAGEEEGGGMSGIRFEGRGHFRVADGVRLFHGGHPRDILEVAGCGEAGEVSFEVELMPAGLALGAVYN